MAGQTSAAAAGRTWYATLDRRILALSVALQLALGALLAHPYDTRVAMAAGYLAGTGQSPYVPHNLMAVFQHVGFQRLTTIGYPPPWPLVTGLVYRGTYAIVPNLLAYNLALKLPVIVATVGLAYLVAGALRRLGARAAVVRRAWAFLLLNPFILYTGAAWGQIDVIATLLAVAALGLVSAGRWASSAALLALAVCVKPTPLPIVLVVLAWLAGRSAREALRYGAAFIAWALVFAVLPFIALGWSAAPILQRPNAHFLMSGALSYTTVAKLIRDPLELPGHWWLLSLLWVPAVAAGVALLRRGGGFEALARNSAALVLVFFLTRTWLAEPNVILVLPLVLVLASLGHIDRRALTALWAIPLAFTVFNATPLELLWAVSPGAMLRSLAAIGDYHTARLAAQAALVVAWQAAGWWVVASCLRRARTAAPATATEGVAL
ncbi:MAG: glycosyltransferase 87 family protein [Thermoleophilia bacterium]